MTKQSSAIYSYEIAALLSLLAMTAASEYSYCGVVCAVPKQLASGMMQEKRVILEVDNR